jgi:DNA-binding NtrC family response regulator
MTQEILIVDNTPAVLSLYSRLFSGQAYSMTLTGSFAAAEALIKKNHYDLLITDHHLGDGLGTDLARLFIKKFPGTRNLLVTSSHLEPEDLPADVELLGKPIEIDRLLRTVSMALASRD